MKRIGLAAIGAVVTASALTSLPPRTLAADPPATSYSPVVLDKSFDELKRDYTSLKPRVMRQHQQLLEARYDLRDRGASDVTMSRGKNVQVGVRTRLPRGIGSWDELAQLTPDEIRERGLWPAGFMPLPHPHHAEGGMVFPQFHIDRIARQDQRDLKRFDLDFDLPDHFLPEYPPAIFLTTHPDKGDVSQGEVVTIKNFFRLFDGLLQPKQMDGLRLLVTPFPQQQFNATSDRRVDEPSFGVTCFDCHVNGHTNAATHLVGDIRPQEERNRIDTPTLRGVNVQRLFGSQRALKTVEDFTEFEQRAAYFDGDIVQATKKGVNILERGTQVHHMGEFQALLDFPPAPKLDPFGKLIPDKATEQELRGQELFFGKARCAECHTPPHYTDNTMHDLKLGRFYKPQMINGMLANSDGPIKTFPLRGLKDSPPYFHDGRLLTIEDAVEFFNLVLGVQLNQQEKADLTAFLYAL